MPAQKIAAGMNPDAAMLIAAPPMMIAAVFTATR
jgi:hypothetical protein